MKLQRMIAILSLLLCGLVPLWGQLYTGSVSGVVRDPSGAVVPNVKVTLTDVAKNYAYTATTGTTGNYLLRPLPPSTYTLRLEAAGFQKYEHTNIVVDVDSNVNTDVTLQVVRAGEVVTIESTSPLLQTEDATVGQVLPRQEINDLPLLSRQVFDLAYLAPGVSQAQGNTYGPTSQQNGAFATNFISDGSRSAQADLLLDGVSVMNGENNPGIMKAIYVPPVDAVQEFNVQQTNFSAEFGNSGGTIVNVLMRSGTNAYHGEAYEFFRNNDLNANNFFNNAAGLAIPHEEHNDFGFTAGGPIIKNKTFFFFDLNGIRDLGGVTSAIAGVPDQAERSGDFGELCGRAGGTFNSAGICSAAAGQIYDPYTGQQGASNSATGRAAIPFNNLATYTSPGNPAIPFGNGVLGSGPGNLIDPVAAKLIQGFPMPNLHVGTSAYNPYANWIGTGANTDDLWSLDLKIDHRFTDNDALSARWSHEWDTYLGANFFGNDYDTSTQGPTKHAAQVLALNYSHTFSPKTVGTLSFGYGHNWYPTTGIAGQFSGFDPVSTLGMPSYIKDSGLIAPPTIQFFSAYGCAGFNGCLGAQAWSILKYASETAHLLGTIDHTEGNHEIKVGGEIRRHRMSFLQAAFPEGLYAFSGAGTASATGASCAAGGCGGDAMAQFLTGYVDSWSQYEIPPYTDTRSYQIGGFVQDNWRVNNKLTVNIGFRYDVETPRTERFNQQSYFNPTAAAPVTVPGLNLQGSVEYAGVNGASQTPFNTYWGEYGPRVGLAYKLTKDTVVRAGYGIYYDPSDMGVIGNSVAGNFLGYDAMTYGTNNVPTSPWLPLEFLRNPFPYGITPATGNSGGALTSIGSALGNIPVQTLNTVPQEQSWSLNVQHQFGWNTLLDIGYVGKKGTHLYAMGYNEPDTLSAQGAATCMTNTAACFAQVANPFYGVPAFAGSADLGGATIPQWKLWVPYPQYSNGSASGITSSFVPWANSIYNGLQIKAEKRFSQGLQFLVSYTWQKSIDDSSLGSSGYSFIEGGTGESTARDPNNMGIDRSVSAFNMPQIFQVSWTYELPFGRHRQFGSNINAIQDAFFGGWQLNGIYRWDDGLPISLGLCGGCSISLPTYGNQNPDLTGTAIQVASNYSSTLQYFADPGVGGSNYGTKPAPYTDGNAPRYLPNVRTPGTNNWTASLFKQVPLGFREGAKLEIRVEAFNLFNHVQFSGPADTNIGDATFGQITSQANTPRQVQLGAKLYF